MDDTQPESYTPEQVTAIERTNKLKLTWGIICLVAPTALVVLTIILYAITQLITNDLSNARTVINVLLFLVGSLAVFTWLPGIVVGIILLATREKV